MSLAWITFLPLLGALAVMLVPRANTRALRLVALAVTSIVALLGLMLWGAFDGAVADAQMRETAEWFTISGLGGRDVPIRFALGVDGISILLVVLTAILMPLVVLSSYGHIQTRVNPLVEEDYVEEVPNPSHRRSPLMALTRRGSRRRLTPRSGRWLETLRRRQPPPPRGQRRKGCAAP